MSHRIRVQNGINQPDDGFLPNEVNWKKFLTGENRPMHSLTRAGRVVGKPEVNGPKPGYFRVAADTDYLEFALRFPVLMSRGARIRGQSGQRSDSCATFPERSRDR
jgi:hypothetical protein